MSGNIDLSKNVQPPLPTEQAQLRQYTLIVYVLYVVSIFVGLTSIVAIIMNYIKRDEVSGTWMESHFNWQIRTFWITLIGAIIGAALSFILIGIPILFAISIWFIYRVIKGLVVFVDNKPIGDGWF